MSKQQQQSSSEQTKPSRQKSERKALIAGDYAIYIDEEMGRGSFSTVYPATLVANPAAKGKEEFAAKYCELKDSESRDRFNEEANNVVRIHDKFQTPYVIKLVKRFLTKPSAAEASTKAIKGILIFEMCRGPALHSTLIRNGPLPLHLVQRFVAQMVEALACCHSRGCEIAHRDVKPENFLLSSHDLETASIALIDFGFSIRGEGREPCGTPMFMSPEVLQGNVHGPPTDIFALGVTILCMIFGLQPHDEFGVVLRMPNPPRGAGLITPQFVRHNIDESSPYFPLRYIIEACLEMDPRRRPTAAQLRADNWIRAAGIIPAKKFSYHHKSETTTNNSNTTNSTSEEPTATTSNTDPQQKQEEEKLQKQQDQQKDETAVLAGNLSANFGVEKQQQEQVSNAIAAEKQMKETKTIVDEKQLSFFNQLDNFSDRIQALLTIANSLNSPDRRAAICAKVARLLCEEVSRKLQPDSSVKAQETQQQQNNANNNSKAASLLLLNPLSANYLNNNNSNGNNIGGMNSLIREGMDLTPLLEQMQWVKSQLSSMMNVLPDNEPLPDSDVAIADGARRLASAALGSLLIGQDECCFGDCIVTLRHVRIVLKKDLAHYGELNSLRRKLDQFAKKGF